MRIRATRFEQNSSFYIAAYGYEDISEKAHWGRGRRNFFILHYVLEGEGYFNGKKVAEGNGFLIRPGQLHEYHSSENAPWKYMWVTFGGGEAENICKKYIKTDADQIFAFDYSGSLRSFRDRLFSENSVLTDAAALSYFFGMVSFLEKKSAITGNSYVEAAKKYMHMHFDRSITVTEIAAAVGIDDRYLYNLFVRYEGVSPKKYLTDLRLDSARSMLANTDATVSEIAASTGFPDVLAFSAFFSKHMHASPTDYRKSVRE